MWHRVPNSTRTLWTTNPREPLPADLLTFQPAVAFDLDESKFFQNLRSFKRGATPGPSGMSAVWSHVVPWCKGCERSMNRRCHLSDSFSGNRHVFVGGWWQHRAHQAVGGEQGDPLCFPLWANTGRHKQWRPSCRMGRSCLHFWMTSVLCAHGPTESSPCTRSSAVSCGDTPESGSTTAKRMCGTCQGLGRRVATGWSDWHSSMIPRPGCGQVPTCRSKNKGSSFLGTPLGHDQFVRRQLESKSREHDLSLSRIPSVADLQSAWALLLHCASARANYMLRVIRPDLVRHFAERHDVKIFDVFVPNSGHPQWRVRCRGEADNNPPSLNGWSGFAQCSPHQCSRLLGQLGRLSRDVERTSPGSCEHDRDSSGESPSDAIFRRSCSRQSNSDRCPRIRTTRVESIGSRSATPTERTWGIWAGVQAPRLAARGFSPMRVGFPWARHDHHEWFRESSD